MFDQGVRQGDATMVWGTGATARTYEGKFEKGECTLGTLDGKPVGL